MSIDLTQIDPSVPFAEQIAHLATAPYTPRGVYVPRANPSAPVLPKSKVFAPAIDISVHGIVTRLRNSGITVTGSDNYLKLYDGAREPIDRPRGIDVLTATPEQWQAEALAAADHTASLAYVAGEQAKLRDELDEAMKVSMASEADTYLDALRPRFDRAADLARTLNAAGLTGELQKPGAKEIATKQDGKVTIETIPAPTDVEFVTAEYGEEAGKAWAKLIDGVQVSALVNGSTLRATLAELLNVGEGHAIHSVGVGLEPGNGNIFEPRRGVADHIKWLQFAPVLKLVPFSDTKAAD